MHSEIMIGLAFPICKEDIHRPLASLPSAFGGLDDFTGVIDINESRNEVDI